MAVIGRQNVSPVSRNLIGYRLIVKADAAYCYSVN